MKAHRTAGEAMREALIADIIADELAKLTGRQRDTIRRLAKRERESGYLRSYRGLSDSKRHSGHPSP